MKIQQESYYPLPAWIEALKWMELVRHIAESNRIHIHWYPKVPEEYFTKNEI